MLNPIIHFLSYFALALTIILGKTWSGIGLYYIISIFLLLINIKHIKLIYKQLRPFIYFLPIFIIIYIFISSLFTNSTWNQIFSEAGFAILRLLLLIIVMSIYIEVSKNHNLILAVRSIWVKFKLKWKWVDDLFIFLELTLRFYPSFQQEWDTINRSKKALGLEKENDKWGKVKSIASDLPGLIIQNYLKAENTANVMKQRGYGRIIPRGVAEPIPFKFVDVVLLFLIILTVIFINCNASI